MGKPAARIGDIIKHGPIVSGAILTGAINVAVNSRFWANLTSLSACGHGIIPFADCLGTVSHTLGGYITVDHLCACGAMVAEGSSDVTVGEGSGGGGSAGASTAAAVASADVLADMKSYSQHALGSAPLARFATNAATLAESTPNVRAQTAANVGASNFRTTAGALDQARSTPHESTQRLTAAGYQPYLSAVDKYLGDGGDWMRKAADAIAAKDTTALLAAIAHPLGFGWTALAASAHGVNVNSQVATGAGTEKKTAPVVDGTKIATYKDPATVSKDNDPKRKPTVVNGVAQPLAGTTGKPKTIPMYEQERGGIATREYEGATYLLEKDNDGFPKFTIFETYLGDSHINSGDSDAHFEAANGRLGELLKGDETLKDRLGLTDLQYKHFTSSPAKKTNPFGLTWHHHQETGKMQLVNTELHRRFSHIGGMEIWGGSRSV